MHKNSEVRRQMFGMVESWKQSGLSQNAFCQQQSLKFHTFYYWYKCYRKQHEIPGNNNPTFVKLKIEKPLAAGCVEIYFPGGVRILFQEPVSSSYLKALVS